MSGICVDLVYGGSCLIARTHCPCNGKQERQQVLAAPGLCQQIRGPENFDGFDTLFCAGCCVSSGQIQQLCAIAQLGKRELTVKQRWGSRSLTVGLFGAGVFTLCSTCTAQPVPAARPIGTGRCCFRDALEMYCSLAGVGQFAKSVPACQEFRFDEMLAGGKPVRCHHPVNARPVLLVPGVGQVACRQAFFYEPLSGIDLGRMRCRCVFQHVISRCVLAIAPQPAGIGINHWRMVAECRRQFLVMCRAVLFAPDQHLGNPCSMSVFLGHVFRGADGGVCFLRHDQRPHARLVVIPAQQADKVFGNLLFQIGRQFGVHPCRSDGLCSGGLVAARQCQAGIGDMAMGGNG